MKYIIINLITLLQDYNIDNDFTPKCENISVSLSEGQKESDFKVANLLEASEKYWLGQDNSPASFIVNLGCEKRVNLIELINANNGKAKDKGAKDIKVSVSKKKEGPWSQVVKTVLKDPTKTSDPLPVQSFKFEGRLTGFVKVDIDSYYGTGAGLQYFHVRGNLVSCSF